MPPIFKSIYTRLYVHRRIIEIAGTLARWHTWSINIFPIPSLYLYRRYTEGIPNKHHFNYAQYSTQKSSHTPTIFWRIRQGIAHYGSVCKSRTWVLSGRKTSQRDYCRKKIASGELRQQKIDFITTFAVSFEGYGTYTKSIQNVGAYITPVINQLNLNFNLSQDRSLRC